MELSSALPLPIPFNLRLIRPPAWKAKSSRNFLEKGNVHDRIPDQEKESFKKVEFEEGNVQTVYFLSSSFDLSEKFHQDPKSDPRPSK